MHGMTRGLCSGVRGLVDQHGVHGHDVRTRKGLHVVQDLGQPEILTHHRVMLHTHVLVWCVHGWV